MGERNLRGSRLGTVSLESEVSVEPAPRRMAHYDCPNGHVTAVPFSVEAEVPSLWECRCGTEGLLRDAQRPEPKAVRPARTHWDMLLERRTIPELEELLEERLALLRQGKLKQSA